MEEEPSSTEIMYDPATNLDELVMQRHKEIEQEISESTSLVGEKEDLLELEKEYFTDDVYQAKVKDLLNNYSHFRRTRPDGNCFYRAFGYVYFERLVKNKERLYNCIREGAQNSKTALISLGFPQLTLEDFHDTFMQAVEKLGTNGTEQDLHNLFNDTGFSDYLVVYLRLLTSGELQRNAEFYQNFIDGDRSVVEFCHQEVEPMYKESDHIQIIALSSTLNVGTRVRYMDRGESTKTIAHDFPEGETIAIHLLYRPGHYDILYPVEE